MLKCDYIKYKKAVELAKVKENEVILDLGCGDCKLRQFLPKKIKYFGVDLKGDGKTIFSWDLEHGLHKN